MNVKVDMKNNSVTNLKLRSNLGLNRDSLTDIE